jgi:hypothetical protein
MAPPPAYGRSQSGIGPSIQKDQRGFSKESDHSASSGGGLVGVGITFGQFHKVDILKKEPSLETAVTHGYQT